MKKNLLTAAIAFSFAVTAGTAASTATVFAADHRVELPTASTQNRFSAYYTGSGYGRLTIGGYSAQLFWGDSQGIVDAWDSAAIFDYYGKTVIADHAGDGFNVIRWAGPGTQATIDQGATTTVLTCASSYQGSNTGYDMVLSDGRYADEVGDGSYIMYTCNDASGYSVTITYWNVTGSYASYVEPAAPASNGGGQTYSAPASYSGETYYGGSYESYYTADSTYYAASNEGGTESAAAAPAEEKKEQLTISADADVAERNNAVALTASDDNKGVWTVDNDDAVLTKTDKGIELTAKKTGTYTVRYTANGETVSKDVLVVEPLTIEDRDNLLNGNTTTVAYTEGNQPVLHSAPAEDPGFLASFGTWYVERSPLALAINYIANNY